MKVANVLMLIAMVSIAIVAAVDAAIGTLSLVLIVDTKATYIHANLNFIT